MKWQYKGEWFESIPIDWKSYYEGSLKGKGVIAEILDEYPAVIIPWIDINGNIIEGYNDLLVYVPKYDKCYTIQRFGIFGNGNKLKMYLEDVYIRNQFYVMAKDVELVIRSKYENRVL